MYSASKINLILFYLLKPLVFVKLKTFVCFSVASIANEHGGYNIEDPLSTRSKKLGTSGKKSDIKVRSVQRFVNVITTKGLVNLNILPMINSWQYTTVREIDYVGLKSKRVAIVCQEGLL